MSEKFTNPCQWRLQASAQLDFGHFRPSPRRARWYSKPLPTFADALRSALTRRLAGVNKDKTQNMAVPTNCCFGEQLGRELA
jgi:hypothetical protein